MCGWVGVGQAKFKCSWYRVPQPWTPPPHGRIKIYCDASIKSNAASVAYVARDSKGCIIDGFGHSIPVACRFC